MQDRKDNSLKSCTSNILNIGNNIHKRMNKLALDIYSDMVVSMLALLCSLVIVGLILLIILSKFTIDWSFIVYPSLVSGMIVFYYTRGKFTWAWSIPQLIINCVLSWSILYGLYELYESISFPGHDSGYIYLLIPLLVGGTITLCKQLLDHMAVKMNATRRKKGPVMMA